MAAELNRMTNLEQIQTIIESQFRSEDYIEREASRDNRIANGVFTAGIMIVGIVFMFGL